MSISHPVSSEPVPALKHGDHLTRDEFERRYNAMPNLKKAELIEGVVHMPSPVRLRRHGAPHFDLIGWLAHYKAHTPCVLAGIDATARLDMKNEPQPDGMLLLDPACGGQAIISDDDYVENSPELTAEISASSAKLDLGVKKTVYRRAGVREYIVWRVLDEELDWFVTREGAFEPLRPDSSGILRSEVFPVLWLDVPALLRGDMRQVLAVLDKGIASPEHAAFVAKHSR